MTTLIKEDQWLKISAFLSEESCVYAGNLSRLRLFVEGVFWILRSGAQWRFLPSEYGRWNSVYRRFARWSVRGAWERFFTFCARDPDMELLIPDSTVIRAHPCAAGALKTGGGQEEQALGRSRGGFSTKIHVAVDALGNPLKFILAPGQNHDITQAEALTDDFCPAAVPADKGYDSDPFRQHLRERGALPVIPSRSNRKNPQEYDRHLYKERHLVECFINKIKYFRHVFSRFDKLAERYMSFLHFAGALIWLR
ncbi:MAG: IS5 family transposase [Desulfobacterales bacterium]